MIEFIIVILLIIARIFFGACDHQVTGGGKLTLQKSDPYFKKTFRIAPVSEKYIKLKLKDYAKSLFIDKKKVIYPDVKYIGPDLKNIDLGKLHWGQRKLLMGEILFLTEYTSPEKKYHIVYAGAADGRHIALLEKMFPNISLDLYDPRDFVVRETDRIRINPYYKGTAKSREFGFFTDAVAESYRGTQNLLFISDIRTVDDERVNFDADVSGNQESQMRWHEIMAPLASHLKFKTRYPELGMDKYYKYLNGEIYVQPWAPINSAETRLVVVGNEKKLYDICDYEQRIAYYNNQMRTTDFSNTTLESLGVNAKGTVRDLWKRYTSKHILPVDFCLELMILDGYTKKYGHGGGEQELHNIIRSVNNVLIKSPRNFDSYLKGAL